MNGAATGFVYDEDFEIETLLQLHHRHHLQLSLRIIFEIWVVLFSLISKAKNALRYAKTLQFNNPKKKLEFQVKKRDFPASY